MENEGIRVVGMGSAGDQPLMHVDMNLPESAARKPILTPRQNRGISEGHDGGSSDSANPQTLQGTLYGTEGDGEMDWINRLVSLFHLQVGQLKRLSMENVEQRREIRWLHVRHEASIAEAKKHQATAAAAVRVLSFIVQKPKSSDLAMSEAAKRYVEKLDKVGMRLSRDRKIVIPLLLLILTVLKPHSNLKPGKYTPKEDSDSNKEELQRQLDDDFQQDEAKCLIQFKKETYPRIFGYLKWTFASASALQSIIQIQHGESPAAIAVLVLFALFCLFGVTEELLYSYYLKQERCIEIRAENIKRTRLGLEEVNVPKIHLIPGWQKV